MSLKRFASEHRFSTRVRDDSQASEERVNPVNGRQVYLSKDSDHRRIRNNHESSSSARNSRSEECEISDLFLVDKRGDVKNLQYESMHRSEIPPYRRAGRGGVLGASPAARIDADMSTDRSIYLITPARHTSRHHPRPLFSRQGNTSGPSYKFVSSASAPHGKDEHEDFIRLRQPKKRNVVSSLSFERAESDFLNYRSIEGKAKASDTLDDDDLAILSSTSSQGVSNGDGEVSARNENARLLQATRANPMSLDSWLRLADHQARMLCLDSNPSAMRTSQRRSLAEIRLSIYSEASKHIGKASRNRGSLLVKIIEEGRLVWDEAKVEAKWKEALAECPSDSRLYRKFLDHAQSNSHAFNLERCKLLFSQAVKSFKSASNSKPGDEDLANHIHLLTRLTSLIGDAGYNEHATATWQAILEYRFFCPSHLQPDGSEATLQSFEQFWESDVPRIGEEGAAGWNNFMRVDQKQRKPSPVTLPLSIDSSNVFVSFSERETELARANMIPALTEDELAEDSFRFVVFSDLDNIPFAIGGHLSDSAVLTAFFTSNGLPAIVDGDSNDISLMAANDPFLINPFVLHRDSNTAVNEIDPYGTVTANDPVQCRVESTLSLFSDGFSRFRANHREKHNLGQDVTMLLDRSLQALVAKLHQNYALAEYYLAWKLWMFPESAPKIAKQILKVHPSSLRLYNAFALLLAGLEKFDKAQGVWSTALKMRSSLPAAAQEDTVLLWHSSVVATAQRGNETSALTTLMNIEDGDRLQQVVNDGKPKSASQQLRVLQCLKRGFDRASLAGNISHASLFADCIAWFSYLTNDHEITAALMTYRELGDRLGRENGNDATQLMSQCKVTLLKHHLAQKRSFRPAEWVKELGADLQRFPSNSVLLEMDACLASHDRLRVTIQGRQVLEAAQATMAQWRAKLTEELRRMEVVGSGSNVNTVRALFNKALLDPESTVQYSPEIWMLWLNFEYRLAALPAKSTKEDQFHRARQVFLNGLKRLPWYKAWALLGMRYFGQGGIGSFELRQVYETLLERGIRVHIDLESYL